MLEIIVGVDGTERGEDALAFARRFSAVTGARLTLAAVYAYEELLGPAADRGRLRDDAVAMLERERASLDGADVATRVVADPSPARGLQSLAEQGRAALIVIGSSHRGMIGRVLAGTTAERLLHGAPCPVAVVPLGYRKRVESPIRTIGVGYDASEESQRALNAASDAARRLDADLRVIRIFDTGTIGTPAVLAEPVRRAAVQEAETSARDVLQLAVAGLPDDVRAEAVFMAGGATRELVSQTDGLDLLVLGSRGYGPRRAVLLGGVSHVVVREAACPVIVLPRGASGLSVARHERVAGDHDRWLVHIEGRSQPVVVELPDEERRRLELSDEEIHALLPTALERHLDANPDALPDETLHDVAWDTPVRVLQTHFIG
jgi:nucleotide-binding universal stress UspA family protein